MKAKTSRTPDEIPSIYFKNVNVNICYPLSILFEKSFASGELPRMWKLAEVCPIYKKGNASDPNNYRPISLTSVSCKIMEVCVANALIDFLREHRLLTDAQHGFLARRSVCTQLLETFDDWSCLIEKTVPFDAIYFDFRRAFDRVTHKKLILKLKSYGISDAILAWIEEFLRDREQYVVIGDAMSESVNVTSGVPQGSVLGPILFLLFINDLPDVLQSYCKLYADDLKVYGDVLDGGRAMQLVIDKLVEWTNIWQLPLAVDKCSVVHVGRNNPMTVYSLLDRDLEAQNSVSDLGVLVDGSCKFSRHCYSVAQKANKITNMLFRMFCTRDKITLLRAFKTYVRPIAEYCCQVWNPHLKGDIDRIESIQRYFSRRLFIRCGIPMCPYVERLAYLELPPLELRRLHYDLTMLYSIVHKENDIKFEEMFKLAPANNHDTRGHHLKIVVPTVKHNTRYYCFANRTARIWNTLPTHVNGNQPVVNAANKALFKKRIKTIDFASLLQYNRHL